MPSFRAALSRLTFIKEETGSSSKKYRVKDASVRSRIGELTGLR